MVRTMQCSHDCLASAAAHAKNTFSIDTGSVPGMLNVPVQASSVRRAGANVAAAWQSTSDATCSET